MKSFRHLLIAILVLLNTGCGEGWNAMKQESADVFTPEGIGPFSAGVMAGFGQASISIVTDSIALFKTGMAAAREMSERDMEEAHRDAAQSREGNYFGRTFFGSFFRPDEETDPNAPSGSEALEKWLQDTRKEAQDAVANFAIKIATYKEQLDIVIDILISINRMPSPDYEEAMLLLRMGYWEAFGVPPEGEEVRAAILDGLAFVEMSWEHIKNLKPYQKGLVVGAAIFAVLPWDKAAKGAKLAATRMLGITRKAEQFEDLGIDAQILAKWAEYVQKCVSEGQCFHPDTPVQTPRGVRRIGDLQIGEKVLARNELTGEQGIGTVLATPSCKPDDAIRVVLRYGQGKNSIVDEILVTRNHRIWNPEQGAFDYAMNFRDGSCMETADGRLCEVVSVSEWSNNDRVAFRNLTVDSQSTYFVGDLGVWVHNDTDLLCVLMYRAIDLCAKNGIPSAATKFNAAMLTNNKAFDEILGLYYCCYAIAKRAKTSNLEWPFVQKLLKAYTARNYPGSEFWRAPRLVIYSAAREVNTVKGWQWHHIWPERYMNDPSLKMDALTMELPLCLHTHAASGIERQLDDFMMAALKDNEGFVWPSGVAADGISPLRWEETRNAMLAFFKNMPPEKQIQYMREAYQKRMGLDLPEMGLDGIGVPRPGLPAPPPPPPLPNP